MPPSHAPAKKKTHGPKTKRHRPAAIRSKSKPVPKKSSTAKRKASPPAKKHVTRVHSSRPKKFAKARPAAKSQVKHRPPAKLIKSGKGYKPSTPTGKSSKAKLSPAAAAKLDRKNRRLALLAPE